MSGSFVYAPLDPSLFDGLTSLTTLGLKGNNLTVIESFTFAGLTSLTELNLYYNYELVLIDAGAFPAQMPSETILCGVSGYCGLTICLQTYGNVTFYLDPLSGRCSNVPPSALASALHE
eukprot:m.529327 g.529327  ORF g.529327 m.529327 type:complete len:119 (+) comp57563_c0_seq53:940-1296(+)